MPSKQNNEEYKGYHHYLADEDITRAADNNGKVTPAAVIPTPPYNTVDERDEEVSIVTSTDADLTGEDLRIPEATEQSMHAMDSNNLIHSSLDEVDEGGDDELVGEEDGENNYYSPGGDLHEDQEKNKGG
jgi:hypothetical protein